MVIKCLVIGGPTGVGKTSLSILFARWMKETMSRNVEIVSCDSVQFYRGLDIGSGKVDEKIRLEIPHHLIDCQDVSMATTFPYSAVRFSQLAENCIKEISSRGNIPLVVGGSLFYLDLLFHRLEKPCGEDPTSDQRLWVSNLIDQDHSLDLSFSRLACQNPQILYGIDVKSKRRIESPLILQHIRNGTGPLPAEPYGLLLDRSADYPSRRKEISYHGIFLNSKGSRLKRAIDQRCLEMIESGLLEETNKYKKYLNVSLVPGSSIGYKESLVFLERAKNASASSDLDSIFQRYLEEFLCATRRYASFQSRYCKKYLKQLSYIDVETVMTKKGDENYDSNIFSKLAQLVLNHQNTCDLEAFFQENHESAQSLHVNPSKEESILYKPDLGMFSGKKDRLKFLKNRVVPLLCPSTS